MFNNIGKIGKNKIWISSVLSGQKLNLKLNNFWTIDLFKKILLYSDSAFNYLFMVIFILEIPHATKLKGSIE